MQEVAVSGMIDYYVVKNDRNEYLTDIMFWGEGEAAKWSHDPQRAWRYGSQVAWHDADLYGGKVYAVIQTSTPTIIEPAVGCDTTGVAADIISDALLGK